MKKRWKILAISGALAIIMAAVLAGTVLAAGPQGSWPGCGMGQAGGSAMDEVSKLLGLTPEQIQEQRQAGKSLVQIAAANNVTEEALIEVIMAEKGNAIQEMVTSGSITQAQADQRLAQMRERVQLAINRTEIGPPGWAPGVNGKPGTGNGTGMMRRGGMRGNQENCTGVPGNCTGAGGMMRAGRAAR